MKKYSIVTLLLSLCFSFSVASAQVADEVVNQIDCANITRPLKLGSRDSNTGGDVTTLQIYLAQANYLEVDPTGYFGRATFKAVQGFQRDHGIVTQGNVGPYTRAKIKEVSCTTQTDGTVSLPIQENPIVKRCDAIGTKSEGWYNSKTGQLIAYTNCSIIVNPLTPAPPVGTLPVTLYATASCTIPVGASKCTVTAATMGHENTKIYDLFNKTRGVNSGSAFSSGNSFTFNPSSASWDTAGHITYGDNILMVRGWGSTVDLATATVKGVCATGSTWNGSVCGVGSAPPIPAPTPTASFTISVFGQLNAHNVTIPVGTPNVKIWSSTNGTNYSAKYSRTGTCTNVKVSNADWSDYINPNNLVGIPNIAGTMASGNNPNGVATVGDVGCTISITYTVTNASGVQASDTINVTVTAATTTSSSTTGSITLGTPNCTIAVGTSQCGATLSWNVTNPVAGKTEFIIAGGFNYTMTQDSYLPTNFMNGRGENVSTYTLKNNGVTLDTKTVTSKCAIGSSWNGTVCAAGSTSVIPVSLFISTSCTIPVGASKCTITAATTGHEGSKFYDLFNKTRGITTANAFYSSNNFTFAPVYGDTAAHLVYGNNILAVRNSGSSVDLATANVNGMCASGSTWNGTVCAATNTSSSIPASGYEILTSDNCIINVGESTCTSTIPASVKNIASGKTYDFYNETTLVTTNNAFTPNNLYRFSLGSSSFKGTAAELKYGANILRLRGAGSSSNITNVTATASCASGSSWNGTVCAAGSTTTNVLPVTLYATASCTIPVGASKCTITAATTGHEGSKFYDLFNKTRGITTGNAFYSSNNFTFAPVYGDTAGHITYGTNILAVRNFGSSVDLSAATVNGICASGSSWNGTVCAGGSTSSASPVVTLTATPSIVAPQGRTTLTWSVSPSVVGSCTASSVPVSPGWNGNWWANEPNGWSQYPATTTEYRLNCVGTNGSLSNTAKAVVSVTAPSAVPITIYVSTSCTIPVGGSTCTVTAATMGHENTKIYDLFNKTRGITTGSAFSLSNRFTFTPTYGDTAAHIIYGANALAVRSWGSTTDLATVTVNGVCASGSTWNGSVCATVVSSAQKATMLGEAVSNANNMVASGVRNVISTLSGANQVFAGSCIDLQSNLHRGNETTAVNKLQDFLSSKGFLSGSSTGFFGDLTIEAVKAYQRSLGLPETGMVYDFTRRAIKAETCN